MLFYYCFLAVLRLYHLLTKQTLTQVLQTIKFLFSGKITEKKFITIIVVHSIIRNELYLIAEYYIANSKNELLRTIILNKEKVEYSVEQQQRNGKEYTVLGVGTVSEGSVTKAQWLYYDAENKILYEYDLPNDELVVFE